MNPPATKITTGEPQCGNGRVLTPESPESIHDPGRRWGHLLVKTPRRVPLPTLGNRAPSAFAAFRLATFHLPQFVLLTWGVVNDSWGGSVDLMTGFEVRHVALPERVKWHVLFPSPQTWLTNPLISITKDKQCLMRVGVVKTILFSFKFTSLRVQVYISKKDAAGGHLDSPDQTPKMQQEATGVVNTTS